MNDAIIFADFIEFNLLFNWFSTRICIDYWNIVIIYRNMNCMALVGGFGMFQKVLNLIHCISITQCLMSCVRVDVVWLVFCVYGKLNVTSERSTNGWYRVAVLWLLWRNPYTHKKKQTFFRNSFNSFKYKLDTGVHHCQFHFNLVETFYRIQNKIDIFNYILCGHFSGDCNYNSAFCHRLSWFRW